MRLYNLKIKNYKSINELSVNLGTLTAIVGKNNFGKSTTLDALQCFYGLREISQADFHLGTKKDIEIQVTFKDVEESDLERYIGYKAMHAKVTTKIKGKPDDEEFLNKQFEKLKEEKEKKINEAIEKYHINLENECTFKIIFSYSLDGKATYKIEGKLIPKNEIFKFVPPVKVISAIRTPDKETTAGTKSNLKELIALLQSENDENDYIDLPEIEGKLTYEEIKSLISQKEEDKCVHLSKDLTKHFQNAINTDSLSVKVKIDESFKFDFKYKTVLEDSEVGREVDILSCGTGLQSMMILSILQTYIKLKKDDNFILLIEEPEVYLHPSLQRKMINTLLKISEKNQTILTTHSPIIISKIDKGNIHCVNKVKGVTHLVDPTVNNIVDELGIQISDILNKQAVVFVEGKDDYLLFTNLIDKIAIEKGLGLDFTEKNIDIIQTDGFDKMSFYANAQILHKDFVKAPYWIIADSDGEVVEDRTESFIKRGAINGIKLENEQLRILSEYAIESYFLDSQLLSEFLQLSEVDLQYMCTLYFESYEHALNKVRDSSHSMNKETFRKNYKPKIMFSNLDKPYPAIQHILRTYYVEDELFMATRERVVEKWNEIDNPIEKFVNKFDCSQLRGSKMKEVINHLEEVVDKISGSHIV
ncbi:AAA family ATPase [Exiguobacterium sp. s5]|uniref:ATP-dependent nuclease n=1 Tax=Exiguobacterium sp. s5 TaxID=2751239 RepID=UPI001BEABD6F|nr:AAA family ATPase [Exiguobacterium sp. s5]